MQKTKFSRPNGKAQIECFYKLIRIVMFPLIVLGGIILEITPALANHAVLNIYAWTAYIPSSIIKKFENETHIRVNISEYDNNETMYAKLKTSPTAGYDLVLPSSYFIPKLAKQKLLQKIDKSKLRNFKNLNPSFLGKTFDPKNEYSLPYFWGTTGIVLNTDYFREENFTHWQDLWQQDLQNKLLVLDDMREVFGMALLSLGYPSNDIDAQHIHAAYLKLKMLLPNIKIFNSDVEQSIYIDEDATLGMGWSGDINLSIAENPKLKFVYPKEGFALWIDCIAIVKNAPHLVNAYKFIDFLLRPDIANALTLEIGYPTPNAEAIKLLPKALQLNPILNPSPEILRRAQIQNPIDTALPVYEKYWELLKIGS